MSFTELDQRLSMQAFKHVTFDVGSSVADEGSRFLKDPNQHFLVLERTDQDEIRHYRHVGFVALKRDEFDEMPAQLTIDTSGEDVNSNDTDVFRGVLDIFNCQETFYCLSDPKSYRFGLYSLDLQNCSRNLGPIQMARMMFRLGLAKSRQRDLVGETRREYAKRGEKLSKQEKSELQIRQIESNPVAPTLGARRMSLEQGTLQRLGAVADIHHNSGRRRRH